MDEDFKKMLSKHLSKNECIELIYEKMKSDKYKGWYNPEKDLCEMVLNKVAEKGMAVVKKERDLVETNCENNLLIEKLNRLTKLDKKAEELFEFERALNEWRMNNNGRI